MMDALARKIAFQAKATRNGLTLSAAAQAACGVTWFHLSEAIQGKRPVSNEVKQRFAEFIGQSVDEVFGSSSVAA